MRQNKFETYNQLALSTVYSEPEGGFHSQLIPEMVKQFFDPLDLPVTSYVLDVGCGQGLFLDLLKNKGFVNLVGVTLSHEDVVACGEKWHSCVHADMSDLPLPSHIVDFVWFRHALEHSPYPLFTLYEMNRVLKVGGQMYVEVPAPNCARKHEYNANHFSVMGMDMWMALMVKAGFTVVSTHTVSFEIGADGQSVPETNYIFLLRKHETVVQERTHAADEEVYCG